MDRGLDGAGIDADQTAPNAPAGQAGNRATFPEHIALMRDYLSVRAIPPEIADTAGIYAVGNARTEIDAQFDPAPAIVFPYRTLDGEPDWIDLRDDKFQFFRLRYLREPAARSFIRRKAPRFRQLKDSGVHVYLPACFDWREIAADASIQLVVTEGECKALSLATREVPAIGLGGVDCIWHRIDDEYREFHPVLAAFKWGGRDTAVVFDNDIAENPSVLAAEGRLVEQLTARGAMVRPVRLPRGGAR